MRNIRCMIVDDEAPALEILENHIRKVDYLKLTSKCQDAFEALNQLYKQPVDLLFLDIEMPGLNGLDLLQSLGKRPQVILTTAYREYALEGYDHEVLDYLLKPIRFQRFLKAVNRVLPFSHASGLHALHPIPASDPREYILVNINRKMHRILLGDILYLESLGNYVRIVTARDKFTVHRSLNALADLLPADRFLRIHKSYIAALGKITAFTRETVEISNHCLPIGGRYRLQFEQAIYNLT